MSVLDGPDFLCVGMPKAGTGWLYDQLDAHPNFWMPPVKEVLYLHQRRPALEFVDEAGERTIGSRERRWRKRGGLEPRPHAGDRMVHRDPLDERDRAFLLRAGEGKGKPVDLAFYASLFRCKGAQLSGDITPAYCYLEEDAIRRVAQRFPRLKILLLVRDPVARAWSRICMISDRRSFDRSVLDNATAFRAYLQRTERLGGLLATEVCRRWRNAAPQLELQLVFFDDVAQSPQAATRDILRFLGADPEKKGARPPDYNRKAKPKPELSSALRDVLAAQFRDEIVASAELFGGPAREWPALYGL